MFDHHDIDSMKKMRASISGPTDVHTLAAVVGAILDEEIFKRGVVHRKRGDKIGAANRDALAKHMATKKPERPVTDKFPVGSPFHVPTDEERRKQEEADKRIADEEGPAEARQWPNVTFPTPNVTEQERPVP